MIIPFIASGILIFLSAFVCFKLSQHFLIGIYGRSMFFASCYLQDLSMYCSITAVLISSFFIGSTLLSSHTTNILLLSEVLTSGYILSFRAIIITVFSYRFRSILRNRYRYYDIISFDGATVRCHPGGVPSFVGGNLYLQMQTSNKVAMPIGVIWLLFLIVALYNIHVSWLLGFTLSAIISFYSSVGFTLLLLPETDEDKPIPRWKAMPIVNIIPLFIFMFLLATMTPILNVYTR